MSDLTWIDHLARREKANAARQAARGEWLTLWTARVLLVATYLFLLVGVSPLSEDTGLSADGDMKRQLVLLLLAGIAAPLLLVRWRFVIALLAQAWALLLVYAAIAATTLWSAYPGVTIRRLVVYLIFLEIGLALAAVLRSPKLYLPPLVIAFTVTLVGDYAVTVLVPDRAFTAIGLQGLHPGKNTLGAVMQMMVIVLCATLLAVRTPLFFWSLVVLVVLAFGLLVLSLSKTSLALALLLGVVVIPSFVVLQSSRMALLAAFAAGIVLCGFVVFVTGAFSLGAADWAEIITGDATFTSRDEIWSAMTRHIAAAPWFGYGWGRCCRSIIRSGTTSDSGRTTTRTSISCANPTTDIWTSWCMAGSSSPASSRYSFSG